MTVLDIANEALTLGEERKKFLARIAELENQLEEARQTLEDVCCGTGLNCMKCGKDARWCDCK